MTCSANAKETAFIKKLEYDIAARQKKFGVDYLTMEEEGKSEAELQTCLDQARADIADLKKQIDEKERKIGENKEELQKKVTASAAGSKPVATDTKPSAPTTSGTAAQASTLATGELPEKQPAKPIITETKPSAPETAAASAVASTSTPAETPSKQSTEATATGTS